MQIRDVSAAATAETAASVYVADTDTDTDTDTAQPPMEPAAEMEVTATQTIHLHLPSCQKTQHNAAARQNVQLRLQLMSRDRQLLHMQKSLLDTKFGAHIVVQSDDMCQFYTGLSVFVFSHLFSFVCVFSETDSSSLTLRDEFLLVLMKMRLNLLNEDLGYRFHVHKTTVSKIFHKWLHVMFVRMQNFIVWPDRDVVRKTLPSVFKPRFSRVVCIIDCTEIFIERPNSLIARAQTFSNYKKHNTVKFLLGITPTGSISFVSKAWGGRVSDDESTRSSEFLKKLLPGDVVMADRGFRLQEDFGLLQCELVVPAFTRGKQQLPSKDVELSRAMSRVRIHVEHVIGVLKNRYTILHSTLPISLVKRPSDTDVATVNKLMTVCAALCNVSECIVPL